MALPFGQLSFPEIYERELVEPLFRPWAELLLEEARVTRGERVLDVACGTGIVARLAAERTGAAATTVGVDLSPAMLAVARQVAPGIDWREGDAGALPLEPGEQFDVVLCHQGLQFVPDKPAAADGMRRALRAGGRLALSTWESDEDLSVLRELRRIVERRVGPIVDTRHTFGAAAPLESLFRAAGFHQVQSKVLSRTITFRDGATFVGLNAMALVGMGPGGKDRTEQERKELVAAIAQDSAELVRANTGPSGFSYQITARFLTATG